MILGFLEARAFTTGRGLRPVYKRRKAVKDADRRRKYYEAEYAKAYRRKAAGLCVSCGGPVTGVNPSTGKAYVNCTACRAEKLARKKMRAEESRIEAGRTTYRQYRATNPNDDPIEGDAQEIAQLLGLSVIYVRALARSHKTTRRGWSIVQIGGSDESKSSLSV